MLQSGPMSKAKKPPADPVEPRAPMRVSEVATAAFNLAILEAHDGAGGDVVAGDAAVHEMLALFCVEALGMLYGRDPHGFEQLLGGLGVYAKMRSFERMHSILAGVPASSLGQFVAPATTH